MPAKKNMDVINVPQSAGSKSQIGAGDIIFVDYKDDGGPFRHRVFFDCYAFSFVQNGQKHIFRASRKVVLQEGNGLLIPQGNSLIAEHSDNSKPYHSVIVFFPGAIGREFFNSYPVSGEQLAPEPFLHFETNAYIREYIRNIRALIACRQQLSREMAVLKVQELLRAVYELDPGMLRAVFKPQLSKELKTLVEHHLLSPLSLEELAFMVNRSLSSFKRDFQKQYGLSPGKYIRERRLELAYAELLGGKSVSEIYLDYGYDHLSNFTSAFKKKYGVSPSNCQSMR